MINILSGAQGIYPMWKNKFYPPGMQPKNWLAYYSSVFNSVELNGTFYRTPKLSVLQKYAELTPAAFKFSVKMNRYITHIIKLKDSEQHIIDFQNLIHEGLSDKVAYFLFQFPPSFHYNEENLERLIGNIPHRLNNVIEFRHASWWNAEVVEAFKGANLTFCNIDFPGLKTEFMFTSSVFYLRLHGNPELLLNTSIVHTHLKNRQIYSFSKKFNKHFRCTRLSKISNLFLITF